VLVATIDALVARYGTRPADLRLGIGPGISARRYEVGPDVAVPFLAAMPPEGRACLTPGRGDRAFLDLALALRLQARAAGVPDARIEAMALCTFEARDRLFSHRRDGAATGRHGLVAVWGASPGT
jgi:copper oxidase (laccase) domain-containing protein